MKKNKDEKNNLKTYTKVNNKEGDIFKIYSGFVIGVIIGFCIIFNLFSLLKSFIDEKLCSKEKLLFILLEETVILLRISFVYIFANFLYCFVVYFNLIPSKINFFQKIKYFNLRNSSESNKENKNFSESNKENLNIYFYILGSFFIYLIFLVFLNIIQIFIDFVFKKEITIDQFLWITFFSVIIFNYYFDFLKYILQKKKMKNIEKEN